jgi:hypothetical protein
MGSGAMSGPGQPHVVSFSQGAGALKVLYKITFGLHVM